MTKIYLFSSLLFLCISCGTRINYLGQNYTPTKNVDVFVSKEAVKRPYEVIGKGYVSSLRFVTETIQRKSVEKAKAKGADAVIFEDYFIINNTALISTSSDSSGKSMVHSPVGLTGSPSLNILFIRYTSR